MMSRRLTTAMNFSWFSSSSRRRFWIQLLVLLLPTNNVVVLTADWSLGKSLLRGIGHPRGSSSNEKEASSIERDLDRNNKYNNETNIFGMALRSCSQPGMAATGLNGDGYCSHTAFDERSHAICIDLGSFAESLKDHHDYYQTDCNIEAGTGGIDGNSGKDFGGVVGRHDFLKDGDLPCVDDPQKSCPAKHWCINEHAFAFYVEKVGGCANVGRVVCDATSSKALEDYEQEIGIEGFEGSERALEALECIKYKCWISR